MRMLTARCALLKRCGVDTGCRHLAKPSIRAALLVGGSAPKQARQELAEGVDIVTGTQGKHACASTPLKHANPLQASSLL